MVLHYFYKLIHTWMSLLQARSDSKLVAHRINCDFTAQRFRHLREPVSRLLISIGKAQSRHANLSVATTRNKDISLQYLQNDLGMLEVLQVLYSSVGCS